MEVAQLRNLDNQDKAVKKNLEENMNLLRIILGILIPPLGVFMTVGVGATLFINIGLTLLGWLPGSIHALWVIVKHEEKVSRETGIEDGRNGIY